MTSPEAARPGMLFVVGAARSGTTYLVDVLGDLFDFGMGPEGHFVLQLARRLGRYGDLAEVRNMTRLLEDVRAASTLSIIRNEWPAHERFDVTLDELRARVYEPSFAAVVYATYRCIADHLGKANVASKNPAYTLHLPLLESLFPGRARYVNLVRDGRDVALSSLRLPWGQNTVYACARSWARCIESARTFERAIGGDRFLNVRYEDLVQDPEATLARLEAFLGMPLAAATRDAFIAQARGSDLAANFGKWKSAMSARDIERFEAVAGVALDAWGYERTCPAPRVGLVEAAWFEGEELARKVRATLRARGR
ncbi:MAG: sulfotransferase [Gammaproteobacteria bacterium]